MVCPYLKNKGSAVQFCLWPPITISAHRGQNRYCLKVRTKLRTYTLKNPINRGDIFFLGDTTYHPKYSAAERLIVQAVFSSTNEQG